MFINVKPVHPLTLAQVREFGSGYVKYNNAIEKAFARLKAMLRKAAERTVSGLWCLIGKLVDIFQPDECANYFGSCGYDPA